MGGRKEGARRGRTGRAARGRHGHGDHRAGGRETMGGGKETVSDAHMCMRARGADITG